MPLTTPGNSFLLAIDKQADEATVSATADYSVPTYEGASVGPVYAEQRVAVTDASSVQGDISKGPTSWEANVSFPMFGDSLGRFLQALWPTDTITGAGPTYTHTYSALGGTQPWIALYTEWPGAGAFEQTFGKGQCTGMTFAATTDETPGRVTFTAIGQVPSVTAYSATLADDLTDGYFTLVHATASLEADFDTPNANPATALTGVQSLTIDVQRPSALLPSVDGVTVTNVGPGLVAPSGSMELLYSSWDAYRATYYGAVAGTAASAVVVTGALAVTFKHTVQAAWSFELYVPAVQFRVEVPVPNVTGDALTQSVTLNIQKPTTGSHVQPVLINGTTPAY